VYLFPNSIQIGGHTFKIELLNQTSTDDTHQYVGDSCLGTLKIRATTLLSDNSPKSLSNIEETLWHEILHQIAKIYVSELDEDTVDRLAQGLYQVFNQLDWHIIKEKCSGTQKKNDIPKQKGE
jgi:hypothetical protein